MMIGICSHDQKKKNVICHEQQSEQTDLVGKKIKMKENNRIMK